LETITDLIHKNGNQVTDCGSLLKMGSDHVINSMK
jgi:hypothetical protein